MKFLVIDTAGAAVRVAASNGAYCCDTDKRAASAVLLPAIDDLLARTHCAPKDLDFLACVVGPGSFTGIRIGVSTVRALGYALGLPTLGLHAMQVLAYNERADGCDTILCLADAGNGLAYVAAFDAARRETMPCRAMPFSEASTLCEACGGVVCADEVLAPLVGAIPPDPDCRALLRAAQENAGAVADWSRLCPVYVRESQAEADLRKRDACHD